MDFNLYHLSREYLKCVRAHFIVTKAKVLLGFRRLKPDTLKSYNIQDNNKERIVPPQMSI
jgi:hypothetical protein